MMLNKYCKKVDAFIESQKQVPLLNKTNHQGDHASWDDWVWTIKPNIVKAYTIYFIDPQKVSRASKKGVYSKDQHFPERYRQLLMSYVLHLEQQQMGSKSLSGYLIGAKRSFSLLYDGLFSVTQKQIDVFFYENKCHWVTVTATFLRWCQKNGFISKFLNIPRIKRGERHLLDVQIKNQQNKMPDSLALKALASITHDLILDGDQLIEGVYYPDQRYHFVCCMATLAMASPNRVAAEQQTLNKQTLKTRTATVKKENQWTEQPVYYLDWNGSKDYKDNDNHILATMKEPVSRVLEHLNMVCEPARVLCRFYESPDTPVKELLGSFQPSPDKLLNIDINKPVNMFQLGYLLGFYDGQNQTIKVGRKNKANYRHKLICEINNNDELMYNSLGTLLIVKSRFSNQLKLLMGLTCTVAEFQRNWIEFIKQNVPAFPYCLVNENKVKLSNALFCFTGNQLLSMHGRYPLSQTLFSIEPADLGNMFHSLISNKNGFSIFTKFGFASDIRITPHQFRHWLNTMAQQSGLSEEVIAMWSGRKDVQQNAVYDHTPESDKVKQVGFVMSNSTEEKKPIRIITQEEYEDVTGKDWTSVTSTGICTQNLSVSPCNYLNDFLSHCPLCPECVHVNRDQKAIELLEKDLTVQHARLEQVKTCKTLGTNHNQQRWFLMHFKNTAMLEQLIGLMKREDIKEGSPIRYSGDDGVFRVTDLANRRVEEVKALLPDANAEMQKCIAQYSSVEPEPDNKPLENLLTKFGIGV